MVMVTLNRKTINNIGLPMIATTSPVERSLCDSESSTTIVRQREKPAYHVFVML